MYITLVQTDLVWENPAANRKVLSQKMDTLYGQTDLIVLPEMFTTGFSMRSHELAETMQGDTVQWLSNEAQRLNAAITGSLIIQENRQYFNRLIWAFPDGRMASYDKKHLFTLASEHKYYTPGQKKLLVEYKGWTICPLICYDLRFPVWSRNTEGYDLLIYIASWPAPRREAWRALLKARAIENQAYTIGVNRVGTDGSKLTYAGDSTLIDFAGNTCVDMAYVEGMFTTKISKDKRAVFLKKLPFLDDRDAFELVENAEE